MRVFVDHGHEEHDSAERIITAQELGFEPVQYHSTMVSPPFPLENIEDRCVLCGELLNEGGCEECGITECEMLAAKGE
jgi:hypothetical protein